MKGRAAAVWAAVLAACIAVGPARAETFSSPGLYSVTVDGWTRAPTADGFAYRCASCIDQLEIEIVHLPLSPQAAWHTTDDFIAALDTKEKQKAFAENYLRPTRPDAPYKLELYHVALAEIGGIGMLVISSKFIMDQVTIPDITMLTVHKGQFIRLRIHTKSGALGAEANTLLEAFLKGLSFEK